MTATIPDGTEPVAIWNVDNPESIYWRVLHEAGDWVRQHIPRYEATWRIDFHLIDGQPVAVVYRYTNDCDPVTLRPEREDPAVVALAELPPPHLLGQP